jgi:hypothetical protein
MINKSTLVEGTLSLDDVVSCLPDNCDTEITLKIQKKNNTYGILSFNFKEEDKELAGGIKVFDKDGKELNIFV